MVESKDNSDSQSNEETFIALLVTILDSLICFLLGHAFSSLSILLYIVELCWLPLKTIQWTESWSASEYVLDTLGEYEGDGDDLIEVAPFRQFLHGVRETMEMQDDNPTDNFDEHQDRPVRRPSMKRRRSPRSLRFKNELAEKSASFAKRMQPGRTNLAETKDSITIADEDATVPVSNPTDRPITMRRRSLKLKTEIAGKTNSIAERIKTEKTKLAERGNFIAERIHLQERSTNIAERIQTERTKLSDRKTAIAQRILLAKSNSVANIKLAQRNTSFKEKVKIEV